MAPSSAATEPRVPGLCRCCMTEGTFKTMEADYSWGDRTENYAQMLLDVFDLTLFQVNVDGAVSSRLICGLCVCRLRDACSFRRQLHQSERTFMRLLHSDSNVKVLTELKVELKDEPGVELKVELQQGATAGSAYQDIDFEDNLSSDLEDDVPLSIIPQFKSKPAAKGGVASPPKRGRPRKGTVPRQPSLKSAEIKQSSEPLCCTRCGDMLPSAAAMQQHVRDTHKMIKGRKCTKCPLLLPSVPEKKRHMLDAHGITWNRRGYKCWVCKEKFDTREEKEEHVFQKGHQMTECLQCPEQFTNSNHRDKHLRVVHGVGKNLPCVTCGETFKHYVTLLKHQRDAHSMGSFVCAHCDKKFFTKPVLKKHLYTHFAAGGMYRGKAKAPSRREHERNRRLPCDQCDRRFSTRPLLDKHLATHVGDRELVQHQRANLDLRSEHAGDSGEKCKICGELFAPAFNRSYHVCGFGRVPYMFDCEELT